VSLPCVTIRRATARLGGVIAVIAAIAAFAR
jgi:hypothetical protein